MAYYANKNEFDLEKGNGERLYPGMVESPQMRWAFIRKIYSILSVQLLITFGVALTMYFVEPVEDFLRSKEGHIFKIAVMVLTFVFCLMMHCFSQSHPWNYILMFLFTVCMACMVGAVCIQVSGSSVLLATALTVLIFVALTLFTFFAASQGYDFNFLAPFLLCATVLLIAFGLIRIFFPLGGVWQQVYGCIGALLFSAYIIYDTDNVIKRFSYDQYIAAAAALFMDMINLFLSLIQILDGGRN